MSSPHEQILTQMIALAEGITGVAEGMATDGREPKQMAAEAARHRADGATVFARILDGSRIPNSPRGTDRTEVNVAWAIAAPAMGRRSALETAYELWAVLYASASGNRLALDWIDRPLLYMDWSLVYDSPTCAIVDLIMTTQFELARIPTLPDGSPLPAPESSIAIQYSADGETWNDDYTDGDAYARWSVDGGQTWGDALRFRGAPGEGGTVETDDTIDGDGSAESPLSVANPGVVTVGALPASPTVGTIYHLTATDATARAAAGFYVCRSGVWRAIGEPDAYAENAGAAYTIPSVMGQILRLTLTEACALTFPAVVSGASFRLQIANSNTYAITWPAGLVYDGGALGDYAGDAAFVVTAVGSSWCVQISSSEVA